MSDVSIYIQDGSFKATTTSTSQGTFKYGPVPYADYTLNATKEDYVFKRTNGFDFRAHRIAKLDISVIDKQEQVLTGVKISLTAQDTQVSQVTDRSGFARFTNLSP